MTYFGKRTVDLSTLIQWKHPNQANFILINNFSENIAKKRKLNLKIDKIHWHIGSNSILLMDTKILIYKTVLNPISRYKGNCNNFIFSPRLFNVCV